MTGTEPIEGLLRRLAPPALAAVLRRFGNFADAEDAVQEALLSAARSWPVDGRPDDPLAWLVRVSARRMTDQFRRDDARQRRELLAASWSRAGPGPGPSADDTLTLMFLCCHPVLAPAAAIPLTLRAVGGLTTREISAAFLVPEPTMGQRISRAKGKLRTVGAPFQLPPATEHADRLRAVLHVLYLIFNEGYAATGGPELARVDLSGEAIRLTRGMQRDLPDDPEVAGLLALMLLTEARREARATRTGDLVPLAEQDRSRWDRVAITEGLELLTRTFGRGPMGEYGIQASIAALHDQAPTYQSTDWSRIVTLYGLLERLTDNPMVTLNRAVATAMSDSPAAGLAMLAGLEQRLGDHHRLHSVRAHLLELTGDARAARTEFSAAAARTANARERDYLTTKAARLATDLPGPRASD